LADVKTILPDPKYYGATILENLAILMRKFGKGEIDHIYYPDESK